MAKNGYKPATLCIHAGQTIGNLKERAVPISQTTSYVFDDPAEAAGLFALEREGFIYTRLNNPTVDVFEKRLAELEGGVGALAFSSGQAAATAGVLNIANAGDHMIAATALYGGTVTLFTHSLRKVGVACTFVDIRDLDAVRAAIRENTKLIFVESIGNPKNDVPDFEALADVAHKAGIPLMCDNTIMTPYLFKSFDYGVDIAMYSCTKFIGGHGTSIGGALVDSGKFDWTNGKFPGFTEPDPSYHGLCYSEALGELAYILKARLQLIRDFGGCMSPFNAWLFLQGLETLHLRMDRHSENTETVAKWLAKDKRVAWVNSGALPEHPCHELTKKYFKGWGAVFGFGIKGGYDAGVTFIESVELCSHLANVGDSKTLVIHPASTTHQQLTPEEQAEAGVTGDLVRLSIGTEHADDIIADIDQALGKACKA